MVAREPEVSVRAGAGAELECVAHGNPAPGIRWRRIREDKVSALWKPLGKQGDIELKTIFLAAKEQL